MCGITGIINFKGNKIQRKVLLDMTDSLAHRGPDDSGIEIIGSIGLGSRRLSIIDLSPKGHQPMSDDKNEIWVTFNGEIYNFTEIKSLLDKKYKFKSDSDTEVIIYSYKEWGIECLNKFNGMFSFALFDSRNNEIFIARDRLGVKPLYYAHLSSVFLFASEIKAILKYPGFKKELNKKGVSSYLSYRYELGHETLFKNIFKLMPGHYMLIKDSKIQIKEYWDIDLLKNSKNSLTSKSVDYCKKEIRSRLEKSVKLRMISDVPVGAYLSGGLDSSIIVALMARLSNKRVKTFSIGFKEEEFNEFEYAKKVAKMYNTEHKEILLSLKDYLSTMKTVIRYKDLPLGVPNEVPIYLMSKELKKDITVVLSGEGADEIFSGYGRIYRSPIDYKKLKLIRYLPMFIKKSLFKRLMVKYKDINFNSEMEHFLYNYSYFPLKEKKFLFTEEMNALVKNDEDLRGIFAKYFNRAKKKDYYEKIWYVFEKIHLPGLLQRLDCTTMGASVEGRVPFVDYTLVEFMFTVPSKYKMKWKSFLDKILSFTETSDEISENRDITKYILKEAFKDMLPKEVLERKKKGFPVPLDSWFRSNLSNTAKMELLSKNSRIKAVINQKNLKLWIDSNLESNKDKDFGQKLWMLLNLEYWLREYF